MRPPAPSPPILGSAPLPYNEASDRLLLAAAAALALAVANLPLALTCSGALRAYPGPLNVLHWINDRVTQNGQ